MTENSVQVTILYKKIITWGYAHSSLSNKVRCKTPYVLGNYI